MSGSRANSSDEGVVVVEMLLGVISELVVGLATDELETNERATLFEYLEKHNPNSVYLTT